MSEIIEIRMTKELTVMARDINRIRELLEKLALQVGVLDDEDEAAAAHARFRAKRQERQRAVGEEEL